MRKNKSYSILITAGGTQEDIDTVRSITNHATGRLGSLIADVFIQNGAKVTYLCGEASLLPTLHAYEIIRIRNVAQLIEKLDELLQKNSYDSVIHSMAVSDFTPHEIATVDEMVAAILLKLRKENLSPDEMSMEIQNAILNCTGKLAGAKISSSSPELVLTLKQTPKVIGRIKTIQPQTILVGFKLLSGASEAELLDAGSRLITRNNCDFVLANDLKNISGDDHSAILMDKSGILHRAGTKSDIAEMIYQYVMERLANKK